MGLEACGYDLTLWRRHEYSFARLVPDLSETQRPVPCHVLMNVPKKWLPKLATSLTVYILPKPESRPLAGPSSYHFIWLPFCNVA
jgi:hypothetical protein